MAGSLSSFLRVARDSAFKKSTSRPLTAVLGNTSADLDSFISAVIFAYFHSRRSENGETRFYIPLLNLADVPSQDLWRLRPEYGTAMRLAVQGQQHDAYEEAISENKKSLLKDLTTIADIRGDSCCRLYSVFSEKPDTDVQMMSKEDIILVDHNALQVPGLTPNMLSSRFNLTGVIDHHVEENKVPVNANPRIIKTGIGSCCSLVVRHLQDEELWPSPSREGDYTEVAKLALAPILIDTANLTATGDKISDVDREAVKFLKSHITPSDPTFDQTAFYETIQESKSNSLNLLNMAEIFERDYKEWTEQTASSLKPLNIGIASLVQDLAWLVEHAGSLIKMTEAMHSFARKTDHDLSILALITKGNGPNGEFRKEIAIVAFGDVAIKALEIFEKDAKELDLKEWNEDESVPEALEHIAPSREINTAYRIWWQGDVSKSRKQVAPLLRESVKTA